MDNKYHKGTYWMSKDEKLRIQVCNILGGLVLYKEWEDGDYHGLRVMTSKRFLNEWIRLP